jgi:hypothetical protein
MNKRILGVLVSFAVTLSPGLAALASSPANAQSNLQETYIDREMSDLKTKLHLTPAQETAARAAMEAVLQHQFGAKSVDQVFHETLQPDQLAEWEVIKKAHLKVEAHSSALSEVDLLAPQLGLSDAQKKQLYPTLFQAAMKTPGQRGQVWDDAVLGVLTPSQRVLYQQQITRQGAWAATFNQNNPALTYFFNFPPSSLTLNGSAGH